MTAFPLSGPAFLRIEVQMGRVEVVAEPRDDVDVQIAPANSARSGDRSAAEAVRVTHTGKEVSIVGPFRLNIFGPGDSVDVVVRVPEASDASISLKYGSMHLAGTLGTVRVALDYGDASVARVGRADLGLGHGELRVEHISGDADVTVKSGRARIGRITGALRLKGSDAGIDIGTIEGAADIATSTGVVHLGDPGPALTIRSAYGPVRIRELRRGTARIEGSYGALTLGVRRGTAVWLDASSRHGVVRNELTADLGPADDEDTLEIHARTGYGDITVHRVAAGAAAGG